MTTKNHPETGFLPGFEMLKDGRWPGGEMLAAMPGLEAAVEAGVRCQSAVMCLMSRRAQEYMRIPERVAACHSPQEFAAAQIAFWQTAWQQYADAGRALMAPVEAMASGNTARDMITFPDAPADSARRDAAGTRRAAA